jgi:hypothetical protein
MIHDSTHTVVNLDDAAKDIYFTRQSTSYIAWKTRLSILVVSLRGDLDSMHLRTDSARVSAQVR